MLCRVQKQTLKLKQNNFDTFVGRGQAGFAVLKSVIMVDGHYELGIPFKIDPPEQPENHLMAERRLQSLKRRLLMNPDLLKHYTKEMEAVMARKHADRVVTKGADEVQGRCWYLPCHCVTNPNKPEKL